MPAIDRQMGGWKSRGARSTPCVYFYSVFTRICQAQYRNFHDLCPQKTGPPPAAALIPPPMLSPRMLPCSSEPPLGSSRPQVPGSLPANLLTCSRTPHRSTLRAPPGQQRAVAGQRGGLSPLSVFSPSCLLSAHSRSLWVIESGPRPRPHLRRLSGQVVRLRSVLPAMLTAPSPFGTWPPCLDPTRHHI